MITLLALPYGTEQRSAFGRAFDPQVIKRRFARTGIFPPDAHALDGKAPTRAEMPVAREPQTEAEEVTRSLLLLPRRPKEFADGPGKKPPVLATMHTAAEALFKLREKERAVADAEAAKASAKSARAAAAQAKADELASRKAARAQKAAALAAGKAAKAAGRAAAKAAKETAASAAAAKKRAPNSVRTSSGRCVKKARREV